MDETLIHEHEQIPRIVVVEEVWHSEGAGSDSKPVIIYCPPFAYAVNPGDWNKFEGSAAQVYSAQMVKFGYPDFEEYFRQVQQQLIAKGVSDDDIVILGFSQSVAFAHALALRMNIPKERVIFIAPVTRHNFTPLLRERARANSTGGADHESPGIHAAVEHAKGIIGVDVYVEPTTNPLRRRIGRAVALKRAVMQNTASSHVLDSGVVFQGTRDIVSPPAGKDSLDHVVVGASHRLGDYLDGVSGYVKMKQWSS